jgi:hypothetical protein
MYEGLNLEKAAYCIGRYKDDYLDVYGYGGEILCRTMDEAQRRLAHANNGKGEKEWYQIFEIKPSSSPDAGEKQRQEHSDEVGREFTGKEYILSAAIHYNDGNKHEHQPKNIEQGVVIGGRRHHNCFMTLFALKGKDGYEKKSITQGFITSFDRFVDRVEGAKIAHAAKQTAQLESPLFSEDLY